jgi:hypothetical protein
VATWRDVERIGCELPEVTIGEWYRQRALVVAGKGLIHLGDGDDDLRVPTPEKDDLLASRPEVFSTIPHLDGSPWVIVRLAAISTVELGELLTDAWRMKAPKALLEQHPDL